MVLIDILYLSTFSCCGCCDKIWKGWSDYLCHHAAKSSTVAGLWALSDSIYPWSSVKSCYSVTNRWRVICSQKHQVSKPIFNKVFRTDIVVAICIMLLSWCFTVLGGYQSAWSFLLSHRGQLRSIDLCFQTLLRNAFRLQKPGTSKPYGLLAYNACFLSSWSRNA